MCKSILLLSFCSLFVFMSFQDKNGYDIGDKVENFTLKNVDGKMVSLSDYNNQKGVVVIFTCNHCPFSVKYEDRINMIHNRFGQIGVPVIAINPNDPEVQPKDSFEAMQVRAKEKDFKFAYLFDNGQKIFPQFGATKTPHVFLLKNEKGAFTVQYIGAIDDNANDAVSAKNKYVEQAVDELLAGKKVSMGFTKAIGCTIKWKDA